MLKEDGNEMFKRKKYKDAIDLYTAGLAERSLDTELNAILHCNRAAAHYYIGKKYYHSLCIVGEFSPSRF